ncbi:MAG: hypothetical protein ABFD96_13265, partial [Armatimonadia bacterium]
RQDFYELKEAVDRVTQTITLLNGRDPAELEAYLSDETVAMRADLASDVNAVYRALSDLRKEGSAIRASRDMTADEKQAAIEELQRAEVELLQSLDIKELRRMAAL